MHVDSIKFYTCPTNAYNSYKIIKLLKSFKIIIVAPTCFSLHKPSSGSSQPVLRQIYNVDIGYIYRYQHHSCIKQWLKFCHLLHVAQLPEIPQRVMCV